MGKMFKRNLSEQIVDELGRDIVAGHLQPGDLLPSEEVLLARYSVSRTVLRDALHVLSGKGLINARPKRGTIVRPRVDWNLLDPLLLAWRGGHDSERHDMASDSLDSLMEVRRIIEPAAAALAAVRASPEDLSRIARAYEAMAAAVDAIQDFMEADLAFHIACLRAAGNDFLLPIAHAIQSAMMRSLQLTNRNSEENRLALPLHRVILEAIRDKDAKAARAAMEAHLNDTERRQAKARNQFERKGA